MSRREPRGEPYALCTTPTVRHALTRRLPEWAAVAAYDFITQRLVRQPHRVGQRLLPPIADLYLVRHGTYQVIYRIDETTHTVIVLDVDHRVCADSAICSAHGTAGVHRAPTGG